MIERTPNAYAVLVAVEEEGGLRLSTPGYSAPNIRLSSAIHMFRQLLERVRTRLTARQSRGMYLFQFDDSIHQSVRSVALGRPVGLAPLVELIVDPYFYFSNGYDDLRRSAEAGSLPAWEDRADTLFWRGRGSNRGWTGSGERIGALRDVPRISLALHLRQNRHADVGVIGPWMQAESDEEAVAFFIREGIHRPHASMAEHAGFKYQLDIDGVANAWATLERFLCGSCVLKVASPFEMWFYDAMRPWEHFVPLQADHSDVDEKLDWCLSHPRQARDIAAAGQALALSLTFEHAVEHAVDRLVACRIALDRG